MAQSAQLHIIAANEDVPSRSGWSAVFALTLCVFTLIASEFMPVSILTPDRVRPAPDAKAQPGRRFRSPACSLW